MSFPPSVKRDAKERAHYRCVNCQSPFFVEVHHIVPRKHGGSDDFKNAAPLCSNCHSWFGDSPDKREAIRERRNWWWNRCAQIDAAQMTPPSMLKLDKLYEEFQGSREDQTQERAKWFEEMKTIVASRFRNQADSVSSANTMHELVASSSASFEDKVVVWDRLEAEITNVTCPNCGSSLDSTGHCSKCSSGSTGT